MEPKNPERCEDSKQNSQKNGCLNSVPNSSRGGTCKQVRIHRLGYDSSWRKAPPDPCLPTPRAHGIENPRCQVRHYGNQEGQQKNAAAHSHIKLRNPQGSRKAGAEGTRPMRKRLDTKAW